jgi:hypothetical protein
MRKLINTFLRKTGFWGIPLIIATGSFLYGVSEKGWDHTFINGDGKGYYAYLPAVFIYHDLTFGFIETYEKEHYQPGQLCDFRQPVEGGIVNRYYAGTAVAQLPFFLVTHFACKSLGLNADGYSRPYQYTILFAACFYLFAGLWALSSFLHFFFREKTRILILVCIALATPLLFYTIYNPDFSHIYSFAFITLFVKYAMAFFTRPTSKFLLILSFLLGIVALIRPVNLIIVAIIPFMATNQNDLTAKIQYMFRKYLSLMVGITIFTLVISIQLIIYYIQTGHFLVYSYGDAGFNFLNPEFFNFLFSFRKGAFLYTPLLFISLAGFVFLFRYDKYKFFTLLLFLVFVIYILSSWSVWTYGMTYGQRPLVEYYFVFALLIGYFVQFPGNKLKAAAISLVILTIPHNLMQMSQHRHYILHWDEMDKDKYLKVFFRTDPVYYGYLWNPIFPVQDDTTGYTRFSVSQPDSGFYLQPKAFIVPLTFQANGTDSVDIVLVLPVFPENDALKKNKLHVMVRRKLKINQEGHDFELTLRNLEAQKWNDVSKKIKLPAYASGEEFSVTISNYGKYSFRIGKVQVLRKR